jgi:Uncharacterised protein conserved in bacteria (DUF2336)
MSVSAALAELGSREALIARAVNGGAEIADFSLRRMIERFGSDGEMREALLSRPHLPAALRSVLVALTAPALSNFVTSRSWLSSERAERVTREARESANIMISAETARDGDHAGACELVAYLRTTGQLTAGLILFAPLRPHKPVRSGALRIVGATGKARCRSCRRLPQRGIRGALQSRRIARRFAAGLLSESCHTIGLSGTIIERVLTACEDMDEDQVTSLLALLQRFEAEALREEARVLALDLRRPEVETNVVAIIPPAAERLHPPLIDLEALEAEIFQAA